MKKWLIGLFIGLFFLLPKGVMAESKISVNCNTGEINLGDKLSCSLVLSVDEGISYNKVDMELVVSNIDDISFSGNTGFIGSINEDKLVISSNELKSSSTLGTITIKFNSRGNNTIDISSVKLYSNEEELEANVNGVETSIKVNSTSNTLKSLSVGECNGCELNNSFSSSRTIYIVYTNSEKIKINAEADDNATVTGTGLKNITKDNEIFTIAVTSESGTTKNYKIYVIREKEEDASLKSLTVSNGALNPSFSSDVTAYNVTVDSDKVEIKATAKEEGATIDGLGEKNLKYGKNEFTITVKTSSGNTKSYLLNINRTDKRNSNAYLKELMVNGENINFEKDITNYTYKVNGDIDELEIKATAELETAKIEIKGNKDLVFGENIVTVTVIAEDDSSKVYKIVVVKEELVEEENEEEETLEELISGPSLTKLDITGHDISFLPSKFEYTISILNEKELDIMAFSDGYNIEIVGNKNLKNGSIIKIIVSDDDGNNNIYKLKIKVIEEDINNEVDEINYIPIIMTSLFVILFILDTVLLIKRIKNK